MVLTGSALCALKLTHLTLHAQPSGSFLMKVGGSKNFQQLNFKPDCLSGNLLVLGAKATPYGAQNSPSQSLTVSEARH